MINTHLFMFSTFTIGTFCLQTIEIVIAMRTEWGESVSAASNFVELFERQPQIDNGDKTSGKILENFTGQIEFRQVQFSYPVRSDRWILNRFQLKTEPGQRIAFVGPSGCGKSTTIQLLERFYDVDRGQLLVDGYDIRSVNLYWLRSQFGLVSQEPVLFDLTIGENIAYGLREFTQQDTIEAAKTANIHDFIQTLPNAYNTNIGPYGRQLSGGEKQRIAIARALIRRPGILLFDEATSAMDSYNEQIVQDALDRASKNDDNVQKRTTITIAHRLSTIKSSDFIVVLDEQGHLAEPPGSHDDLLSRFGPYYHMQKNYVS